MIHLRFTVLYVISGFATMTFGNDPKTIERGLQRDMDEKVKVVSECFFCLDLDVQIDAPFLSIYLYIYNYIQIFKVDVLHDFLLPCPVVIC